MPAQPIVILGAGIIGLTTAVRLAESHLAKHYSIHIIADHFPTDALDAKYASTIAGAHHLSFADDEDERQIRWDKRTFQVMMDEWRRDGEQTGLMALKQTEYYVGTDVHLKIYESHPDFKILNNKPSGVDHSISFTSLTMTPLTYLKRLSIRLQYLGVRFHRAHLPSLSHLAHPFISTFLPSAPAAVILCVGLGAIHLGGLEDNTVFPTRGQVIKVRAPWVRNGYTRQVGSLDGGEGGERTYVIPRPDGEVILGGTREIDDWEAYPREDTKYDILRRALQICPELLPAYALSPTKGDGEDIAALEKLVVSDLVGFRPSRKDGVRLDRGDNLELAGQGGTVRVYHNYGHGGAGWQACWGSAEDAVALVVEDLGTSRAKL